MAEVGMSFEDRVGETLVKQSGDLEGRGFSLKNLERCTVIIMDSSAEGACEGVTDSRILVGPCSGLVSVANCDNCVVSVVCQELKLSGCRSLKVYARTSKPITLEQCEDIGVGAFNVDYADLQAQMEKAGMDADAPVEASVQDLSEGEQPSWRALEPAETWLPLEESMAIPMEAADDDDQAVPPAAPAETAELELETVPVPLAEPELEPELEPEPASDIAALPSPVEPEPTDAELYPEYAKWLEEWEASLEAKRAQQEEVSLKNRKLGAEAMDKFFDERTDAKARRQSANRQAQEEKLRLINSRLERGDDQPWDAVADLVDLKVEGGTERQRKLIIQLKNMPLERTRS